MGSSKKVGGINSNPKKKNNNKYMILHDFTNSKIMKVGMRLESNELKLSSIRIFVTWQRHLLLRCVAFVPPGPVRTPQGDDEKTSPNLAGAKCSKS